MAKTSNKSSKTSKAKKASQKIEVEKSSAATVSVASVPATEPNVTTTKNEALRKLPSSWHIARQAADVLHQNWKLFLGITLIYAFLTMLLVRGFSAGTNVSEVKELFEESLSGQFGQLIGGASVFLLLVSKSGNSSSDVAAVYQTLLTIIGSLAVIWALRHVLAGNAGIRIRDAYYQGMYPLVPVILVFLVILIQLLPLILGASLYGLVAGRGIIAPPFEYIIWGLILFGSLLLTLYLLASYIFSIYIAALPDMTPVKALRSAKALVRGRRWSVIRKLLLLPIILFAAAAVIMLPIIYLLTPLAPWVFFLLSMIGMPVVHTYLYMLYRELLV